MASTAPDTRVELLGLAAPLAHRECERGLTVTLPPGVPGAAPAHSLKLELQRVAIHPQSEVADLTSRLWKKKFADQALPSPALSS